MSSPITPDLNPSAQDLTAKVSDAPPRHADVVIVGSGMGGGMLAHALRDSSLDVLVLERGDYLPSEPENWDAAEVFAQGRYANAEKWRSSDGAEYKPGQYYWVGGNTKMYGAALTRFRAEDFGDLQHSAGVSPAWPITYDEIEPYYSQAEVLLGAHGQLGGDPTEPYHSEDYPFGPLPHEPEVQRISDTLEKLGVHPFPLPMGISLQEGGRCATAGTCHGCDGFPCRVLGKSEADVTLLRPALQTARVSLSTRTRVIRLYTDGSGRRIRSALVERDGERYEVTGGVFVLAAGAANTAAILLRSEDDGKVVANASGQVGRNYMQHNMAAVMAVGPHARNVVFQKSLAVNDFYLASDRWEFPMGSLATFGKLTPPILKASRPYMPMTALKLISPRTSDWWLISEDLPDPNNRVTLDNNGGIVVHRQPNNQEALRRLIKTIKELLAHAGYPLAFAQRFGLETTSHHCGTTRMGTEAATSVLRPDGRVHDVDNLYIADSSPFPSSAANNPSLTIAALAIRMGGTLRKSLGANG